MRNTRRKIRKNGNEKLFTFTNMKYKLCNTNSLLQLHYEWISIKLLALMVNGNMNILGSYLMQIFVEGKEVKVETTRSLYSPLNSNEHICKFGWETVPVSSRLEMVGCDCCWLAGTTIKSGSSTSNTKFSSHSDTIFARLSDFICNWKKNFHINKWSFQQFLNTKENLH